MRASRSMATAPAGRPSTLRPPERWDASRSWPSWAFHFSESVACCWFHAVGPPLRSSSRRQPPADSLAGGSKTLSPIRVPRLTASGSSLSWQRSLRPPPASPGDLVCRRELRSASDASRADGLAPLKAGGGRQGGAVGCCGVEEVSGRRSLAVSASHACRPLTGVRSSSGCRPEGDRRRLRSAGTLDRLDRVSRYPGTASRCC
jgi:hypothetical protein